jgi:hypothetical protein
MNIGLIDVTIKAGRWTCVDMDKRIPDVVRRLGLNLQAEQPGKAEFIRVWTQMRPQVVGAHVDPLPYYPPRICLMILLRWAVAS